MPKTNRLLAGQILYSQPKETTFASLKDDAPRPDNSFLISPNKKFLLTVQKDGNLVIYGSETPLPDSLILPANHFVPWFTNSGETMQQRAVPNVPGRFFIDEVTKQVPTIRFSLNSFGELNLVRDTFSFDLTKDKFSTQKKYVNGKWVTETKKIGTYKEKQTLPGKVLWSLDIPWNKQLAKNPEIILQNTGELDLFVSGKKVWGTATGYLPANFPLEPATLPSNVPTTSNAAAAAQTEIQKQQAAAAAAAAATAQANAAAVSGPFGLGSINPIFIIGALGVLYFLSSKK
jgi:hypothetical protein